MDNETMVRILEELSGGYEGALGEVPTTVPTADQLEAIAKQVREIADSMWFLSMHADAVKHDEYSGRYLVGLVGDVARTASQRCIIIQDLLGGEDPSARILS